MTDDALEAFQRDYFALCERHGLMLAFDSSYVAREVLPYDPDAFADLGLIRA